MQRFLWILAVCAVPVACGFDKSASVQLGGDGADGAPATDGGTPDAPAPKIELRINLNGNEHQGVDYPGTWEADDDEACDGDTYTEFRDLQNTNDEELFQTTYYGQFRCELGSALPAGSYEVTLLMAEITRGDNCFGPQGERVFNVDIEGERVLTNFDLLAESDGCLASFTNNDSHPVTEVLEVEITDGTLTVDFGGDDNALVQAIQLIQL